MGRLSGQQDEALRQLLGERTPEEWAPQARQLDRALDGREPLELTPGQYDALLPSVVRLRLRRALLQALEADAISGPAAAQILGYMGHHRQTVALEDLLDGRKFPNLASDDFAFLRDTKARLGDDVQRLKAAAQQR